MIKDIHRQTSVPCKKMKELKQVYTIMQRKPLSEHSCVKCLSIKDIENIYKWAKKIKKGLPFSKPFKSVEDAIKHYGYVYYLPFKCFYCILPCTHYCVYNDMNAFIRECKEIKIPPVK